RRGRMTTLDLIAGNKWTVFQLKYTAGERLTDLANSLDEIVLAYEQYVDANEEMPDEEYYPPFVMNDMIDVYVDYLNLLCVAILLRREDLIPRIQALNEGSDFDQIDAVLEELLKFFLPDRPELDEWLWNKPYRKLLDAIDSDTPDEMAKEMKHYVKSWYKEMKGVAHFWGKHEQIKPEYTPYYGYWAMCAAAFSYLYNIDDSSYRNETVYPKDLVDYARSIPRNNDKQHSTAKPLRVAGSETCPKSGHWFSPAKADSQGHFSAGTIMPDFPDAQYGLTIWQWIGD
ncbi:MAG TPA: PoNe immunity protein domain-containing protein, partial [Duganella sp.]|uniref:PoNe immunity protein domain-containing protein n=1 Tax=Duganella sp. TaxID=1904440 RepID=UPI002ED211B1